jgi:hypothetical protein
MWNSFPEERRDNPVHQGSERALCYQCHSLILFDSWHNHLSSSIALTALLCLLTQAVDCSTDLEYPKLWKTDCFSREESRTTIIAFGARLRHLSLLPVPRVAVILNMP